MDALELITKDELKHLIDSTFEANNLDEKLKANFTKLINEFFIEIPIIFNGFSFNDIEALEDDELVINIVHCNDLKNSQYYITVSLDLTDEILVEYNVYNDDENSDEFNDLIDTDSTVLLDIQNVINHIKTNIL